jgi:hypothetical protein
MTRPLPMEPNNIKKNNDEYEIYFQIFKPFTSTFDTSYHIKYTIDVLMLFSYKINIKLKNNEEIKFDYDNYKIIYENFKNSIKDVLNEYLEEKISEEKQKENYKKIFLTYLNDCEVLLTNLNIDHTDNDLYKHFVNHISDLQNAYNEHLNKKTVVQGGKKSSEYIDYKFQNKIYRRKIRYEGKKKYIILNKQKVFIKNKK